MLEILRIDKHTFGFIENSSRSLVIIVIIILFSGIAITYGQTWDLKTDKEPYKAYGLDQPVKISWNITDPERKIDQLDLKIVYPEQQRQPEQEKISKVYSKPDTITGSYIWNPKAEGGPYYIYLIANNTTKRFTEGHFVEFQVYQDRGNLRIVKYDDRNLNGKFDRESEKVMPGWSFDFVKVGGTPASATTDKNGEIYKTELPVGNYTITERPQPGWNSTTPSSILIEIKKSEDSEAYFGNYEEGTLSIINYNDLNQNGQLNDEPSLAGWDFTINGPQEPIAKTTGSYGEIRLKLPVGTYSVRESLLQGWISTTGAEKSAEIEGNRVTELQFGNYQIPPPGRVNVIVFRDDNGNGTKDHGEPDLSGWEVSYRGPNSSSIISGVGSNTLQLLAGNYIFSETLLPGWINTTDMQKQLTLAPGGSYELAFGNYKTTMTKFWDKNANGIQDQGEPGLAGWRFNINGPAATTTKTSDASGQVNFGDLQTGQYVITENLSDYNWYNTTPASLPLRLPGPDIYFGNDKYRTLKIIKFNDLNRNSIRDSGEPGLSGWEFQVSGIANPVYTDTNGNAFVKVKANREYVVSESLPIGWYNSTPLKVSKFIDPQYENFSVEFGDYLPKPPVINISSYYDKNGNGIRDQGENTLSNRSFWIWDPNNNVQKANAGNSGYVEFIGSIGGPYTVKEIPAEVPCWYNTTPLIVSKDVALETKTYIEFGNNQSIQRCNCESVPSESTQKLMIDTQNITIYKIVDPSKISADQINQKDGIVINYTFAICVKPKIMPTDMVLAIDTSGSLIENGPSALNGVSNGIAKFANMRMASPDRNLKVGLVSWDDNIDEIVTPTTNYTSILEASKKLKANLQESTNYSVGMNGAQTAYDNLSSSNSKKVIVFITDAAGEYKPFLSYPRNTSGYTIDAIVVGPVKVNETFYMLKDLTTKFNGNLILVNDISKIGEELDSLANLNLAKTVIKDVKVVETLPSYLKPLGYFGDKPKETINQDGTKWRTFTYEWNITNISSDACWSSGISALFCGRMPADISLPEGSSKVNSEVVYVEESGRRKAIALPEGTLWLIPSSESSTGRGGGNRTPGFEVWVLVLSLLAAGCIIRRR